MFDNQVDMGSVFPPAEFGLYITREVEIELLEIPDVDGEGNDKLLLKEFIRATIELYAVQTTGVFGFGTLNPDGTPPKHQVVMGFGQGSFRSTEDFEWYQRPAVRAFLDGKPIKKSGLGHNEADASQAVLARRALVVTNEKRGKPGPLRLSAQEGGHILYLREVERSGLTLKDAVRQAGERFQNSPAGSASRSQL